MTYSNRLVVLDTETTGLKVEEGHRIVEIGCVELVDRQLTGKTYHQYINPERLIDAGALAVHGINDEFLKTQPLFNEIAEAFYAFVKGACLIIHNAPFDIGFLEHELLLMKAPFNRINQYCEIVDTLTMARRLHPGQRNSLDALCKRYDIDNSQREAEGHGALLDAEILAQVYLAMTIGQDTLFGEMDAQLDQIDGDAIVSGFRGETSSSQPLRIIFADENEIKAHQAFLKQMDEKSIKD
jgi:DNA polymerase-3 subunit epsilon